MRILCSLLFLTSTLFGAGHEIGSIHPDLPPPRFLPPTVAAAADGRGFLAAWTVDRYAYSLLCVAPIDLNGNPGPTVVVAKAGIVAYPQLFPAGDGYALIYAEPDRWRLLTLDARGEARGASVDLGPRDYLLFSRSVGDGRRVVLAVQAAANRLDLIVFDVATRSVSRRTALLPRDVLLWGDVTLSGDRLLVTSLAEGVYFVSVDDGAVSTFRDTSDPDPFTSVRAPVGENVLVASGNSALRLELQSAKGTVRASETVPLGIGAIRPYKLIRTGANFLLVFIDDDHAKIYGMLVSPDGHALSEPRLLGPYSDLAVAGGGDHALLVFQDGSLFDGLTQSLDLTDGIRIVHEERPSKGFTGQRGISLASDGIGFLSLFQESAGVHPVGFSAQAADPSSYTLAGAIGADGVPRDGVKVVTTDNESLYREGLAFGGGVYLEASYYGAFAGLRRLSPDGKPLGTTFVPSPQAVSSPVIASDGKDFLVVWEVLHQERISDIVTLFRVDRIQGVIVHPDGTAGPVRTLVGPVPSGDVFVQSLGSGGGRYVLAYSFAAEDSKLTWDLSAVPVSSSGEPGTPLPLFPATKAAVSIAGSGRDFLLTTSDDQKLYTQRLLIDGTALRLGERIELFRGFDDIAPAVAWNGTSYVVVWRYVTPQGSGRVPPSLSFLAMTHVRGENVDPVTFLGTGDASSANPDQPALAVNALGTEVVVVNELRRLGDLPRAVAYTASDIAEHVFAPAAPVAVGAQSVADGETVTWIDRSSDERGFTIIGHSSDGRDFVAYAPPGATTAKLRLAALPMTIEVKAWNEAGMSASSTLMLLPTSRTPGRRR